MAYEDDIEIVRLLKSSSRRDFNKGGKLFDKSYKDKSISSLKKRYTHLSHEDVWQDAAASMVVNIQEGKYQVQKGTEMFTYFYHLIMAAAHKEFKKSGGDIGFQDSENLEMAAPEELEPDGIFELVEFREAFESCLKNQNEPYVTLLKNIYQLGLRLIDFYKILGIDTYNNAKVKHHTAKKKLLACLKNKLKDE